VHEEAKRPRLLDRLRQAIRVRHDSIRTEEAYVQWARRFILFHNKRHPSSMGAEEVNTFLTHLAVKVNAPVNRGRWAAWWACSSHSSSFSSEQLLDGPDVIAIVEQMRGEGVAKGMAAGRLGDVRPAQMRGVTPHGESLPGDHPISS